MWNWLKDKSLRVLDFIFMTKLENNVALLRMQLKADTETLKKFNQALGHGARCPEQLPRS